MWRSLLLIALFCGLADGSFAKDIKRIDKRLRSEAQEFAVSLAAEAGGLGHSFIIWNQGDAQLKSTIQQAVGFYPNSDKSKLEAVFGSSPGRFFDDAIEKPDLVVIVAVNGDVYAKARQVFDKWKASGNYLLGFSDCTTFVSEVGAALGLKMPNRLLAPNPIDYVKAIAARN